MVRIRLVVGLFFACNVCFGQVPQRIEQALQVVGSTADSVGMSLWGHPLGGPLVVVEPQGRRCYATENLLGLELETFQPFWAGFYPDSLPLANTSLQVRGQVFTVVVASALPDELPAIRRLVLHELFHGLQRRQGWPQYSPVCSHLASERNRMLLRLECNALLAALASGETFHLQNALIFRYQRLVAGSQADSTNEYQLEFNEGLAEYTGTKGSANTLAETAAYLTRQLHFLTQNSFERSAAYVTGPLYGLLLDRYSPTWRKTPIPTIQPLSYQLSAAIGFWPSSNDTLSLEAQQSYGADSIRADEAERFAAKQALQKQLAVRFVVQPQLKIPFLEMNVQFDPNRVDDFAPHGSVYYKATIRDVWGTLQTNTSLLIGYNWGHCQVPAPTVQRQSLLEGEGYTLQLKDGWNLQGPDSEGNFTLVRD